jgi:hypothetical protein
MEYYVQYLYGTLYIVFVWNSKFYQIYIHNICMEFSLSWDIHHGHGHGMFIYLSSINTYILCRCPLRAWVWVSGRAWTSFLRIHPKALPAWSTLWRPLVSLDVLSRTTYIHTYIYIYIYIYWWVLICVTDTNTHTHIRHTLLTHLNIHTYIDIWMHICVHGHLHAHTHACIHRYMNAHMHTRILTCTHTYTHT